MEEIIIDLLVLLVGFGPITLAFKHQERKERKKYKKGNQMIKNMCENIKKTKK